MGQNFGFGNAVFTQLEVTESKVIAFQSSDMILRSYIWVLAKYGGRDIEVFVTHLSHLPHPNEIRQDQVRELVERLKETKRPWILMGDMNAHAEHPEIKAYAEVAHPVFRKDERLFAEKTYPSENPTQRLDYIFFSSEFDLVSQTVLETKGTTDHRSIRTVLKLAR